MAEEANEREEEEAKSKEAQINRLISSIQANIRVLISVLFPRLCRLMWANPDSIIKEMFARGTQNLDNYCLYNRESWDLKSGIQAKGSGIPLTIVLRNPSSSDKKSGMCEFLYVTQLRYVQLLNFILSYTKFDDIYCKTILFKELRNKIEKIPARATPHDEKFSKKTTTTIYHKKYCKAASNTF